MALKQCHACHRLTDGLYCSLACELRDKRDTEAWLESVEEAKDEQNDQDD